MPQQFENPANPEIHATTTAEELCATPTGRWTSSLRCRHRRDPHRSRSSVEGAQARSAHRGCRALRFAGHLRRPTRLAQDPGLGAGFIPANLDTRLIDEVLQSATTRRSPWRAGSPRGGDPGGSRPAQRSGAVKVALRRRTRASGGMRRALDVRALHLDRPLCRLDDRAARGPSPG